ncbi:aldose epimerase family protein [Sphingomonas sp. PAMC 26605]|uniref:aldose epimerase family protein n=1 Tax=Sphingomonas sp. PAMC 26605 TaxID=1112214 RepID=UPI00026CA76B|nr:aldose epimerase family protein [Sphingomonas sp. PAMC 26605]
MFRMIALATLAFTTLPSAALAAGAERARFGTLPDGSAVEIVTLTNAHGMKARILSYGAILQGVDVPDRDGKIADVTLGYRDMNGYITAPNYFGATVGRYANRIKAGRFTLDGHAYTLATNDKTNALHGGAKGFDKRLWRIVELAGGASAHVTLSYTSADGEEGYPGALSVTATYTLGDNNELTLDYRATTTKPTVVNITNHSFFNLGGEAAQRSIYDAVLTIPAETTTPVDRTLIPTGAFRPVAGTPLDFRTPSVIGSRIRDASDPQIVYGQGYDENYVLGRGLSATPRLAARVTDPASGRTLEVLSNQPGVQLYTGNFLDGTAVGKSGHAYRQGDGIALEPQVFPDTPNQPMLGSARLDPGQTYHNVIVYRFSTTR